MDKPCLASQTTVLSYAGGDVDTPRSCARAIPLVVIVGLARLLLQKSKNRFIRGSGWVIPLLRSAASRPPARKNNGQNVLQYPTVPRARNGFHSTQKPTSLYPTHLFRSVLARFVCFGRGHTRNGRLVRPRCLCTVDIIPSGPRPVHPSVLSLIHI